MSREKKEMRQKERATGMPDALAMQANIRKRYAKCWPSVVLELTKRIQSVNGRWTEVMTQLMRIEGCRISYYREGGNFVVEVRICELRDNGKVTRPEEVERHAITVQEVADAQQYIEVLVMDRLAKSDLIAKHYVR